MLTALLAFGFSCVFISYRISYSVFYVFFWAAVSADFQPCRACYIWSHCILVPVFTANKYTKQSCHVAADRRLPYCLYKFRLVHKPRVSLTFEWQNAHASRKTV